MRAWMTPVAMMVTATALAGCPERRYPERGTELVFKKLDGGREVFEGRLAQLQVKARIIEDGQRLSVRLADGVDVARVKRLLLKPARLELCEELLSDARAWCSAKGDGEVSVEREESGPAGTCFFLGSSGEAVKKAAEGSKVSGRVLLQQTAGRYRTFAAPKDTCLSPRFLEGKWRRDESLGMAISLTLDTPAARDFEKLTGRLVKQRLLIVLDAQVESAPVVMEAIPGGRIQVTARLSDEEAALLTAALVGGPLEGLELVEERAYGPPRL